MLFNCIVYSVIGKMAVGGLPLKALSRLSLKEISVSNFLVQKQISAKETFCLRCFFLSR